MPLSRFGVVVLLSASGLLAASGTDAGAGPAPLLGSHHFAPMGTGFGTVRPSHIFNGGDPSGTVDHLRWKTWGGASAIGYGLNPEFKPEGGYYAKPGRIEMRASNLGECRGHVAYRRLQFREGHKPGDAPVGRWKPWENSTGDVC